MNISEHRDYDCNAFLVWGSPCPFITWWISPSHCILMNFHGVCIFFFRELWFRDERSRAHWPSTTQVMPRWTTSLEEKQVWSYWTVMDWYSKVLVRIMGVALIRNRRKLANCFRIVFSMFLWKLAPILTVPQDTAFVCAVARCFLHVVGVWFSKAGYGGMPPLALYLPNHGQMEPMPQCFHPIPESQLQVHGWIGWRCPLPTVTYWLLDQWRVTEAANHPSQ